MYYFLEIDADYFRNGKSLRSNNCLSIFLGLNIPFFSEPVINPLFARRAANVAGKGILSSSNTV